MRTKNQTLLKGMRIGPQIVTKPIEAADNTNSNQRGYIAKVFYRDEEDKWYASTSREAKGMIVFIRKRPAVGEKLKIKKVYDTYATAEIVQNHEE